MLYKALKYTKSPACRTFAPDPTGGAYSASKTPSWWGGEHILSKNPTPLSPADIESRNGEVESWQPYFRNTLMNQYQQRGKTSIPNL